MKINEMNKTFIIELLLSENKKEMRVDIKKMNQSIKKAGKGGRISVDDPGEFKIGKVKAAMQKLSDPELEYLAIKYLGDKGYTIKVGPKARKLANS